jgi:hypothetical protein
MWMLAMWWQQLQRLLSTCRKSCFYLQVDQVSVADTPAGFVIDLSIKRNLMSASMPFRTANQ